LIKVGTDLIEVERIKKSIQNHGENFLKKVFTEKETEYCEQFQSKYERYAGKFAAKEAVQKALMAAYPQGFYSLINIEILNDEKGRPYVNLKNEIESYSRQFDFELSVSHIKELATATIIMVKK
jgi:holo-[acyl-carrier protein] synthase